MVHVSKRSDTIILERVKNGLMMGVHFSKRNRWHLHKKTVFTVPRKVRVTQGAVGEPRQCGTSHEVSSGEGQCKWSGYTLMKRLLKVFNQQEEYFFSKDNLTTLSL